MTSDAKIGLLLGFVFILVIVSLVNGLPGLIGKESSDNRVKTTVPPLKTDIGITDKANGAVEIIDRMDNFGFETRNAKSNEDPRFTEGRKDSKKVSDDKSDNKQPVNDKKIYVVKEGDNLGKIARKVYGKEIGNKQATVDMIYKANLNALSSPDDLSIGQELIIPPLNGEPEKAVVNNGEKKESAGIIDAVKNIFGRKKTSTLYAEYVVKHDDNLWKIASTQLGDGTRNVEIKKINNSILMGSNKLSPGMKLKIPQQ